jgi:hypothetical protein
MTRVTFGLYRAGVRNAGMTLTTAPTTPTPTPFPTATAAIVRHHREGPARAWHEMDRSFRRSPYWGQRGTPQGGWADAIRRCYSTYRELSEVDARPAFAAGLNRDLEFPPDELGVYIDVVLLDPAGYAARLVLWDSNELTQERAVLYAAPAWRVLEDDLGNGRVTGVEVWHLRTAQQITVGPDEAEQALADVERVVRRLVA